MNEQTYQQWAWTTAQYPEMGTGSTLAVSYAILGAAGEAGELANKWKKVIRDANGTLSPELRSAILAEVGDTLWYLAAVCTELNADLGAVAQTNIDKLASRQNRGAISGSGDNR